MICHRDYSFLNSSKKSGKRTRTVFFDWFSSYKMTEKYSEQKLKIINSIRNNGYIVKLPGFELTMNFHFEDTMNLKITVLCKLHRTDNLFRRYVYLNFYLAYLTVCGGLFCHFQYD